MSERVALTVAGCAVEATTGVSVAAAVLNARGSAFRTSVSREPRGPLCGMGVCFECRLTIDGVPHQRSCQLPCENGTAISMGAGSIAATGANHATLTPISVDVLIVGAGPAGIAAACTAAEGGARVAIIEDNPQAGGQIWRNDSAKRATGGAARWLSRLRDCKAVLRIAQVVGAPQSSTLLAETPTGLLSIAYGRLILACGARESFVPFPGWTLPGVYGAGGLQALVKSGYNVAGKKVVVAGSGPLLFAVAAYLRERGADLRLVAEQASAGKLRRFGMALVRQRPGKVLEALRLRMKIGFTPYRAGCWPIRAVGVDRVESVVLTDGVSTWTEPCDALACGFGLVPNLELPTHLGCQLDNGFVRTNEHQETSVAGVFAVGELTGIGGLDKALIEGQIAGNAAADRRVQAKPLFQERDRWRRFVVTLDDAFALRDELRSLATPETIVCRCEDVAFGQLKAHANWRDAKLQTRCGMGPCQGRVCGPALRFLFGWSNDSIRPPLFPTALGNLIAR